MRIIFILLLQCLFIGCFAQTGKIHVKKVGCCDFELIADSVLLNKTCTISAVSIAGINSSDTDEFSKVLTYYPLLNEILVSKKTFENDLKDVCDTKEYKLEKIEVKGKYPNNIYIDFFFKEK